MKRLNQIEIVCLCSVAFAAVCPVARAAWAQWAGNGHFYQVVAVADPITWPEAQAAAAGAGGYLATITSAEENAFVISLAEQNVNPHSVNRI